MTSPLNIFGDIPAPSFSPRLEFPDEVDGYEVEIVSLSNALAASRQAVRVWHYRGRGPRP